MLIVHLSMNSDIMEQDNGFIESLIEKNLRKNL